MLARHATRAGISRASFVGVVSPPSAKVVEITDKPPGNLQNPAQNDGLPPPGRPAWKYAYEDLLWSKQTLPLNLRAVLQVLLRLSDHFGRVWWSQAAIAEQAGCTVRTLRRLLPALETSGYARVEPMTFRQLSVTQASLGLPLPGRCDDGRAPDLITLLVAGKPAMDLRPLPRRRTPTPGQTFLGTPRTGSSFTPPENPARPVDKSSADPRDLSGDLDQIGGSRPVSSSTVRNVSEPNAETRNDELAWNVLRATYEAHYKRVYQARPTDKPLPHEARMLLAGHLADMATLLRTKFVERNVDVSALEKSPIELLADEALRVWFASSGTNDYLRRVSHRMSALSADLPYRVRKALDTLLERFAPKPEPRLALPSVAMLAQSVGRAMPTMETLQPTLPVVATEKSIAVKPSIAKTNLTEEVRQVLEGLSQHAALYDLAQTPVLAGELVMVSQDRGVATAELLEAIEDAAKVCQRQRMAPASVRSGLLYKFVVERFDDRRARCSTA